MTVSTLRFLSIKRTFLLISLALLTAACQKGFAISPPPTLLPTASPSPTLAPTERAPVPLATLTPTLVRWSDLPTPTPTLTPTVSICSPLHGYSQDQIPGLVSNPFNPPPPGSDNPHAGVDLADRQPGSLIALAGRPVQAVLPGAAAAVVADRFPFGNALIVETPLSNLPPAWVAGLNLPLPFKGPAPHTTLTCPSTGLPIFDSDQQSIYILYAHMQEKPQLRLDDTVACGQRIGLVGSSGNALNPHLHLEARVGPSGARFQSLSHYDNHATLAEMDAYCTWTVRGIFQVIDPLILFLP